jgi:hypothetical protein
VGEFDGVFITMFHRPTADVICLRSSKMRPVVQLTLMIVAFQNRMTSTAGPMKMCRRDNELCKAFVLGINWGVNNISQVAWPF